MNKVILYGRLSKDPEYTYTQSGKGMARVTLAVDRIVAKGQPKETDFIPLVLWGKQAELFANSLSKGSGVLVCGKIRTGSYTDKNGNKRYTTDVFVDEFSYTERKGSNQQSAGGGFEGMGTVSSDNIEVAF